MYYRNAAGIIIAYDVTNGESFVNTKRWIEEVKNNCGENGTPIVLVGNKCDLPNKIVSLKDQEEYAKLMKLPFFETSAKDNINIDEVFIELSKLMLARQEANNSSQGSNQQARVDPGRINIKRKDLGGVKKPSLKCCNS